MLLVDDFGLTGKVVSVLVNWLFWFLVETLAELQGLLLADDLSLTKKVVSVLVDFWLLGCFWF